MGTICLLEERVCGSGKKRCGDPWGTMSRSGVGIRGMNGTSLSFLWIASQGVRALGRSLVATLNRLKI